MKNIICLIAVLFYGHFVFAQISAHEIEEDINSSEISHFSDFDDDGHFDFDDDADEENASKISAPLTGKRNIGLYTDVPPHYAQEFDFTLQAHVHITDGYFLEIFYPPS